MGFGKQVQRNKKIEKVEKIKVVWGEFCKTAGEKRWARGKGTNIVTCTAYKKKSSTIVNV